MFKIFIIEMLFPCQYQIAVFISKLFLLSFTPRGKQLILFLILIDALMPEVIHGSDSRFIFHINSIFKGTCLLTVVSNLL